MGLGQKLREALWGIIKTEKPKPATKVIVCDVDQDWGKIPVKSFSTLQEYLLKDWMIWAAASHMAHETSRPIKITGSKDYTIVIEGKTAIEYVEDWMREVDIDARIALVSLELISMGNSFIRLMDDGSLQAIPLVGIEKPIAKTKKTPIYEKYNLKMLANYGNAVIPFEEFIHFRINRLSDDPLGHGIIESLLQSTNSKSPSLMSMREKLREAMTNLALKAGSPTEYVVGEMDDADEKKIAKELEKLPYWGKRAVLNNADLKIITSMLPRSGLVDAWNDLITMETFVALSDPILRLVSTPGYTEASSRVAEGLHQKKIDSYQRVIKRGLEQIIYKCLEKSAFDPDKAKIRVEFQNATEVISDDPKRVTPKPKEELPQKKKKIEEDEDEED